MRLDDLATALDAECATIAGGGTGEERDASALRTFEICCAYEQICSDLYFEVPRGARPRLHAAARGFGALAAAIAASVLFTTDDAVRPRARAVSGRTGSTGRSLGDLAARCRAEANALAVFLTTLPDDLPQRYATLPECFTRDLVDLRAYARFAAGQAREIMPPAAVVVGIRTTGSYLAPIWLAAFRSLGCDSVALTARPRRDPRLDDAGRFTDLSPGDVWIPPPADEHVLRTALAGQDVHRTVAVVIDDLAFTGSSFVRIDNYLRGLGIDGERVMFGQNSPLVVGSLTAVAAERLPTRRLMTAPTVPDGPTRQGEPALRFFRSVLARRARDGSDIQPIAVTLAPPTFAQRYLAARTTVPADELRHFNPRGRDRHYLIDARIDGRPTRLFAKVFGVGFFADREVARLRRFRSVGYDVVTHAEGFLFYEWIDGQPLDADGAQSLTDADLDGLADYAALTGRINRAGRTDPVTSATDAVERLRRVTVLDPDDEARLRSVRDRFVREALPAVPVVDAPRNQGHWHHVRSRAGGLRRVHLDLGEWSWRMDPAEELAAAVLELGLSPAQEQRVVTAYAQRSGDDNVEARMRLAAVSYVARLLDSYRFWDGQMAQLPPDYRRPSDDPAVLAADRRRRRIGDALRRVLDDGERMPGRV